MRNLLLDEQIRETNPVTIRRNDRLWRDNAGFGIDLAQQEYDERQRRVVIYAARAELIGTQEGNVGMGVMLSDGSRSWKSCTQAARDMDTDPTSVRRSAETAGRTTAKGHTFLFTCPKARAKAALEASKFRKRIPTNQPNPGKPIISDRGERWMTAREASAALHCSKSAVTAAASSNGAYRCKGRILRYEQDLS